MRRLSSDPEQLEALDQALRAMIRSCPVSERIYWIMDHLDDQGMVLRDDETPCISH